MADEVVEGEPLEAPADIAAARAAFLADPPPVLSSDEPIPQGEVPEGELLDEAITPPAVPPETGGAVPPVVETPAPGVPDTFVLGHDQYGNPISTSREQAYQAYQVQQALRSEQGIRALVANGLTALGYSVEQVREALAASEVGTGPVSPPAPGPAAPFDGLDDEDVLTVGSIKSVLAQVAADAAAQATAAANAAANPIAEQLANQQQQTIRNTTDAALVEVLGALPADPTEQAAYRARVDAILKQSTAYYNPEQWADPNHIRLVVQRSKAEIDAADEARYQAYLHTKRQAKLDAPPNIGGGAGGEGPLPEPKNLNEAREQARAAGFFS